LFPIESAPLRAALRDGVLFMHLRDTAKCWRLQPGGAYQRVSPKEGERPFSSQEFLLRQGGSWRLEE
jgi:polyphosphate kinase